MADVCQYSSASVLACVSPLVESSLTGGRVPRRPVAPR
jgi:hypothetical protein